VHCKHRINNKITMTYNMKKDGFEVGNKKVINNKSCYVIAENGSKYNQDFDLDSSDCPIIYISSMTVYGSNLGGPITQDEVCSPENHHYDKNIYSLNLL